MHICVTAVAAAVCICHTCITVNRSLSLGPTIHYSNVQPVAKLQLMGRDVSDANDVSDAGEGTFLALSSNWQNTEW